MQAFAIAVWLVVLPYSMLAAETCSSGAKTLDEKFGFRDVRFDTIVKDIQNLKQVPQDLYKTTRVKAYVRTTDTLNMFGQPLASITYFFFDDRLFVIDLQWGGDHSIDLLQGFGDAFGCELKSSDGLSGRDLSLVTVGEKAKFYGSVHITRGVAYGVAFLQRLGVQQAIDEAIRKDAATQF